MAEKLVSGEEYKQIVSSRPQKPRNYTKIATAVAVVVLFSALSFYGGMQYEKAHVKANVTAVTRGGFFSTGSGGLSRRGGGLGQVTSVSPTSVTINNLRTSASETFSIISSTTITDNGQTVSTSDIQTGETIIVMTSGSGNTTATNIIVNPGTGGGLGGSSSGTTTAPSSSTPIISN